MAADTRQRMIDSAVRLLAVRGLDATSFSEVLEASGAPRGSIYHHFPHGKDQLVDAALDAAGQRALDAMARMSGTAAVKVVDGFLALWRAVLTLSDFSAGCAVLAVTVETSSPALAERTAGVFRAWRSALEGLLTDGGLTAEQAPSFAALLIAASEGAVVLSRAERSIAPFDLVADSLRAQVKRLAKKANASSGKRR